MSFQSYWQLCDFVDVSWSLVFFHPVEEIAIVRNSQDVQLGIPILSQKYDNIINAA